MPEARPDTYSIASGASLWAGIGPEPALSLRQLEVDGIWTWFSDPRSVFRNGATYIGWVASNGDSGVTKYTHATNTSERFVLAAGLDINDHANVALCFLPDGRLMCVYSRHNDTAGFRCRIALASESVASFAPEVLLAATTPASYSNPYLLTQTNRVYNCYRSGAGGVGTNPWNVRAYSVSDGTWDTERTWFANTGKRPYPKFWSNGVDRVDILFTDMHPNQGQSSVYHAYMQLDSGGNEMFYRSDGTLIGGGPITPSDATLVYSGATTKAWTWDIHRASDGTIHALFATFPTTEDHRLQYAKCVSGTWSAPVQVAAMGVWLVPGESEYSGGACIDSQDPTRVYVSVKTPSIRVWELSEWRTSNAGASWGKFRDITSGSAATSINARPHSPIGHDGTCPVVWWDASLYSYYTNYVSRIMGFAS